MKLDHQTIKPYIEKGLVSMQQHPEEPMVVIYNYTPECQFSGAWDAVTRACRGLILDHRGMQTKVLARPFEKFFNYQEHVDKGWPIPTGEPQVYEKYDGSLGIMYMLDGKPRIATRGSFTSDQAQWATAWLHKNVPMKRLVFIGNGITHLFEIIYPANRIVVNYPFDGLVHLATLDNETGRMVSYDWGGHIRVAKKVNDNDLAALAAMDTPNSEGFVAVWPNGERIKIKFANYVRLHKVLTGLSVHGIWESLAQNKPMDLGNVPDEFYNWYRAERQHLLNAYNKIEVTAHTDYENAVRFSDGSRKQFALCAQACKYPGVMFAMYDKKPYAQIIWKMVRPPGK